MILGNGFEIFGTDHLAALACTGLLAAGLIWLGKRRRGTRAVTIAAWSLAAVQVLATLIWNFSLLRRGVFQVSENLPFHLCDTALLLAVLALLRPSVALAELVYLWGLAGTLQGLITPIVQRGYPDLHYFYFFTVHSGIVVTALFLVFGLGLRPRRGVLGRAFGWLVVHAAISGTVDFAARRFFDVPANYMFLCEAPAGTLLTQLGPWPWYLAVVAPIALVFFLILLVPLHLTGGLAPARADERIET